ncbi:MAG: polysaccharide biosynthesis C-terminal domain-containing protein [Flavobacteriales bacterium]|nr:polysaccharide biosynthesis C-terminal domain-containing protein [Flavobacteriales bacterium]
MIRTIVTTTFSKFGVILISFAILVSTTQFLGAEGKGYISLFLLNVTLVQLISSFIGGPALVYLLPRFGVERLLVPSYLWALVVSVIVPMILFAVGLQDEQYLYHLMFIGAIDAIGKIHLQIILGRENIKSHNWISFGQSLVLLFSFWIFFRAFDIHDISAYIGAIYIAYLFTIVAGFLTIYKELGTTPSAELKGTWRITVREMTRHGFWIQLANISQLLNYRLSYYLLQKLLPENNYASLGYYATAINLAEASWVVSKSLAMIQYSRISNTQNPIEIRHLSTQMWKIAFYSALVIIGVLVLISGSIWAFVFGSGDNFEQIRPLLGILAPGIFFMALNNTMSAHLAGRGHYELNARVSGLGLILTGLTAPLLIVKMGLYGAALSTSITYSLSTIYQSQLFLRESRIPWADLWPSRADGRWLRQWIQGN